MTFFSFFSTTNSSASATVCVKGFSIKTERPLSIAAFASSKCVTVGVTMSIASQASIKASAVSKALIFNSLAIISARFVSASKKPTSSNSALAKMQRKWILPKCPVPRTPILSFFFIGGEGNSVFCSTTFRS